MEFRNVECEMASDCHYGSFMSLYIRLLYCEILGEHYLGCALGQCWGVTHYK